MLQCHGRQPARAAVSSSPRSSAAQLSLHPAPRCRRRRRHRRRRSRKLCPRSRTSGLVPCAPAPFLIIRFTVKLKPNPHSCVFRVGSGQISLGWGGVRVGKIPGAGGLWNGGRGARKTRDWPFSFITRGYNCD